MEMNLRDILSMCYENKELLKDADYEKIARWRGGNIYFLSNDRKKVLLDMLMWLDSAFRYDSQILEACEWIKIAEKFSEKFSITINDAMQLMQKFVSNNDKHPLVIAMEGLDGSGKTMQATLLYNHLKSKGKKVLMLDFPQYNDFFGCEIGRMLSSGNTEINAMNVDVKSMSLWYAIDRWKTISEYKINNYDYIIFNRYTLSSAVYQSSRQYQKTNIEFIKWIFELEHTQLQLPVPDIYIYLNINEKASKVNNAKKSDRAYVEGLDIYEQSSLLLSCCQNIYLELSNMITDIKVVECSDVQGNMYTPEKIEQNILEVLDKNGLYI